MSTNDEESEKALKYRLKKIESDKESGEKLLSENNLDHNSNPQKPFIPNYQSTQKESEEAKETNLKTDPMVPIQDPEWKKILDTFQAQGSDKFTINNNQIQDKLHDILIQRTAAGQIEISTKKANPDPTVLNAMVAHYKAIAQKTGALTCIINAASNPEITATFITQLLNDTPPPSIKPIINDPAIRAALEKDETEHCKNAKNALQKYEAPSRPGHPQSH